MQMHGLGYVPYHDHLNGIKTTHTNQWSGQIIATSHDLTPKCSWGGEIPLFQGNLGWWNIIIWPAWWSGISEPNWWTISEAGEFGMVNVGKLSGPEMGGLFWSFWDFSWICVFGDVFKPCIMVNHHEKPTIWEKIFWIFFKHRSQANLSKWCQGCEGFSLHQESTAHRERNFWSSSAINIWLWQGTFFFPPPSPPNKKTYTFSFAKFTAPKTKIEPENHQF